MPVPVRVVSGSRPVEILCFEFPFVPAQSRAALGLSAPASAQCLPPTGARLLVGVAIRPLRDSRLALPVAQATPVLLFRASDIRNWIDLRPIRCGGGGSTKMKTTRPPFRLYSIALTNPATIVMGRHHWPNWHCEFGTVSPLNPARGSSYLRTFENLPVFLAKNCGRCSAMVFRWEWLP